MRRAARIELVLISRRLALCLCTLAACGRIGFDSQVASDAEVDAIDGGAGAYTRVAWTHANFNMDSISSVNLDGSDERVLVSQGLTNPYGLFIPVSSRSMFWTDHSEDVIKTASIDLGVPLVISSISADPRAIAMHPGQNLLFWTDEIAGTVSRVAFATGTPETIHVGANRPLGIDVDAINNKLYVAEQGNRTIVRMDLDGGNIETLIGGLDGPVAVDVVGGQVYFSESAGQRIQKVSTSGGIPQLVVDNAGLARDLDVDFGGGWIYWVDVNGKTVERARLDGSDRQVLVSGLVSPNGIALY
jgi:DNA-binding beta-propeller fold protein YncE